ncbi:BA75_04243T0 [Komagataella pastoris]|uniref:BA75_04243T0 n=1 Tax=Komagataella pastoris TaxID=4922 RepID=A0A1B2JFK9_PICPA|nr:BA75_04243T0 [Komagataella pastoris]
MEIEKVNSLKSWFTKEQRQRVTFPLFRSKRRVSATPAAARTSISLPSLRTDANDSIPKLKPLALSAESPITLHSPIDEDYALQSQLENQQFADVVLKLSGDETINLKIPEILHNACEFIKNNDPVEGIFRVSGSLKKVKEIEDTLSSAHTMSFEGLNLDSFDAATILKRFITRLSLPLISANLQQKLQLIDLGDWEGYAETLESLNEFQLHLLLYLLEFFNNLLQPEVAAVTKMDGKNIARIFQVVFFKPDHYSSSEDLMINFENNELILVSLIENSEQLKAYFSKKDAAQKEENMLTLPGTVLPSRLSLPEKSQPTIAKQPKRLSNLLSSSATDSGYCIDSEPSLSSSMGTTSSNMISDSPSSVSTSIFSTTTATTYDSESIPGMAPSSIFSPSDRSPVPLNTPPRRKLSFAQFRLPSK